MRDIERFFISAGILGTGSVIFAIILFVVGVWEHVKGKAIRAVWFLFFAFIAFASGSYQAWHEQFVATEQAQQKLDDLSKPQLVLTPVQVIHAQSDTGLEMLIDADIKNLGAPSAAQDFRLRAQGPGYDTGFVPPTFIPDGYKYTTNGKLMAVFHTRDLLQEKVTHAIQRGDIIGGWIRFVLPVYNTSPNPTGVTLTIAFKDINDKEYQVSTSDLNPSSPLYSPAAGSNPLLPSGDAGKH
jgi:hypothetical protein